ncbi:hypothetical protein COOONC_07784 [Cooperia oncophora]
MMTPENQSYERRVIIGLLSRVGFREQFWHNKIQSYFVILSFLLTIDNVTYFFLFTRIFGLWWVVPYAVCMLVVGFPLAYLEMALGQYTSTGIFLVFDRMTPAFVGVGVSALIFNFLLSCTDHMLFADMSAVAMHAMYILSNEMPWSNCLGQDHTKGVGVSALIFNFLLSCTDHMLFADMSAVAMHAMYILSNEMPWSNCLGQDHTKGEHRTKKEILSPTQSVTSRMSARICGGR